MDWMPTMLSLAGVALPENRPLDGVDLSPLLLHGRPRARRRLFWQYGSSTAMRDGPWKFVNKAKGAKAPALFHLGDDLGEARPVTNEPARLTPRQQAVVQWQTEVARTASRQAEAK